jgi:hypothetical protein
MPGAVQAGADVGRKATRSTSKPIRALEALEPERTEMRKNARFAVAVALALVGALFLSAQSFNWFAPSRIDPFALMQAKKDLPHEQYDAH